MQRAAADLFVRRECNPDAAVRNLRVGEQILDRRHDLGDAGLVVSAEQRRAGRGDDVVADTFGERGNVGGAQDDGRVIRQPQIAAVVRSVDDRFDSGARHLGRCVHVGDETDGRTCRLRRAVAGTVAVTYPCWSICTSAAPIARSSAASASSSTSCLAVLG